MTATADGHNIEDLPANLTTSQVGRLFNVDPKTVVRWADAGKLPHFRTPAVVGHGHRRFPRDAILALLPPRATRNSCGDEVHAAWTTLRELLDAGHEVTFRDANGGYEVESGKTIAGTVYHYGDTPEAAILAVRKAAR